MNIRSEQNHYEISSFERKFPSKSAYCERNHEPTAF